MKNLKSLFLLDEKITYLNHGSFGACPKYIFDEFIKFQKELESNPIKFLDDNINENILTSQNALSHFIKCHPDDIIFFQNPTTAMNEVIRNLNLQKSDEILTTNHEYGALDKAWSFITTKNKAKYIKTDISIPLTSHENIVSKIESQITKNTKAIFISHITSATGLIFPVKDVIKLAKKYGVISIVDGAHVPGHIDLDLTNLNPDFYTGTCHKWLLSPKGVSFLYVKKEHQNQIEPLIISWGYKNKIIERTQFQDEHLWQGTRDVSPFITIPKAIEFRDKFDWNSVSDICKKRIIEFGNEIKEEFNLNAVCKMNPTFLGQMLSFELNIPIKKINQVKHFIKRENIVIPIFEWENKLLMRISLNGYNSEADIQHLKKVIKKLSIH